MCLSLTLTLAKPCLNVHLSRTLPKLAWGGMEFWGTMCMYSYVRTYVRIRLFLGLRYESLKEQFPDGFGSKNRVTFIPYLDRHDSETEAEGINCDR